VSRESIARRAGLAVAAVSGSLLVAGTTMILLFVAQHPGALPVHTVVSLFYNVPLTLAFAVVSAVIVSRQPWHPIGWLFGVVGLAVGVSFFTEGYAAWALPGYTWTLWVWALFNGPTFFGLAMGLLMFPTGRPASRRWRWLARLLWLYLGAAVAVTAVAPWPRDDEFLVVQVQDRRGEWPATNPVGWAGQAWLADAGALVVPVGIALLLVALFSLLPRWRRAVGDERQQIKWLGLAGLLAALVLVFGLIQTLSVGMPDDDPVGELVGNAIFVFIITGIPVAVGLGIVRYRLYDIDLVISKTLVYGGLVLFIGLAYVVGVVAVGELVSWWAGSSTLLALAVTAAIAAAFHPLRRALQTAADRWVFGDRAAPYELMTRLGHELGQAVAHADVLARIAETAGRAARANAAQVTAIMPNGETVSASWPAAVPAAAPDAVVPVHDDGEVIGEIAVSGAGRLPADKSLLRDTAAVSSGALRNLRLIAELESLRATIEQQNQLIDASRHRLLAAAEDERRRLAQLVEQRLGPDLTVLGDTLPTLQAASSDPQTVSDGARRLATHAGWLIDNIRALSRDVLPPLLSDHGLAPALRALLRRVDTEVTFDVAPSVGVARFPVHIETTVYLCCRAAVDAAGDGPRSAPAELRLWRDDGVLAFSVSHDAPCQPSDDLAALGDRVTTIGGELTFTPDGAWSSVTGRFPLAADDRVTRDSADR